jgi:hypothetical protein
MRASDGATTEVDEPADVRVDRHLAGSTRHGCANDANQPGARPDVDERKALK